MVTTASMITVTTTADHGHHCSYHHYPHRVTTLLLAPITGGFINFIVEVQFWQGFIKLKTKKTKTKKQLRWQRSVAHNRLNLFRLFVGHLKCTSQVKQSCNM